MPRKNPYENISAEEKDRLILESKAFRVRIDELANDLEEVLISPERTLSFRALQAAKHNLGEDLRLLGLATPYPNSMDTSNTTIDPTADVASNGAEHAQS